MATLREYYDTQHGGHICVAKDWFLGSDTILDRPTIRARVHLDFQGNSKYMSLFFEERSSSMAGLMSAIHSPFTQTCRLGNEGLGIAVDRIGIHDYIDDFSSETLQFSRRVTLYIDRFVGETEREQLKVEGTALGLFVAIRDRSFALSMDKNDAPMAFVSHDSRDKDVLVRDLVGELFAKHRCRVWYDEYSLSIGDSLREKIEEGLKACAHCILIVSPNFISNEGWARNEFDSIYTRETIKNERVFLPVWHEVTKHDVYNYSPKLADRVALNTSDGIEALARKIAAKLNAGTR